MRVDENNRKRRKAPKTRTGCRQCKQAHTRCSEDKPECRRCIRLEKVCEYASTTSDVVGHEHDAVSKTPTSVNRVSHSLPWHSLSTDDARALNHYMSHSCRWISTHSPRTLRHTWTYTIPRCAASLPATRHALLAVALVDEPIANPTTTAVLARSRLILRHYNLAIQALTRPGASPNLLDTTLTSILAWLLEILGFNSSQAKMHISAATSLAAQHIDPRLRALAGPSSSSSSSGSPSSSASPNSVAANSPSSESEGVWALDIPALLAWATSYIAITPAAGQRHTADELRSEVADNPVLEALLLRRGLCPIGGMGEVRDAWVGYFTRLAPGLEKGSEKWEGSEARGEQGRMTVEEAQEFIAYWKIAAVRYRYVGTEPLCVILLGYTMSALARCLLPTDEDEVEGSDGECDRRRDSFDFILNRAEDMLEVEMAEEHKVLQEEMLCLLVGTIERYARLEIQRERARRVQDRCGRRVDYYALAEARAKVGAERERADWLTLGVSSMGTPIWAEDGLLATSQEPVMQKAVRGSQLFLDGWPAGAFCP